MIRCYFYAPTTESAELNVVYDRIRTCLDRPDIFLSTNRHMTAAAESRLEREAKESPEPMLERMDAFVIEGTRADAEVGFLLAHAIALKKHTLYLYQRGTVAKVLSHLSLKELPPWIHLVSYHDQSLERHIEDFFMMTEGKKVRPSPRIKFTLRITSMIEDYLRFKTLNTKVSKADWVRDVLDRIMAEDADWQVYLKKRSTESDE